MKRRRDKDKGNRTETETPPSPDAATAESAASSAAFSSERLERADRAAAEGAYTDAADLYGQAVAQAPTSVSALLGLGSALAQLGRYEGAERELRRALKLAPEDPEVRLQLGTTLYKRGNYPDAVAELRKATELDGNAAGYLLLGEALNQIAEPDQAIEALERGLALSPDNGRTLYALGIAYDRKNQFERAAEMYRLAREAGRSPSAV
ncbi:hypothetical protein BH20GEM2_BH20GEM2_11970 [soil metagenome]|jgi:Flp pilus assembly protein TadD